MGEAVIHGQAIADGRVGRMADPPTASRTDPEVMSTRLDPTRRHQLKDAIQSHGFFPSLLGYLSLRLS
jgi:hypothetical protein